MIWNHFSESPTELRLECISFRVLAFLKGLGILAIVLGIGGLVYAFMGPWGTLRGVGMYGSFGVIFLGQLLFWIRSLLQGLATRFRFDLTTQTLYIENTPAQYEFLPHTLPLSELRALRFLVFTPRGSSTCWHLELVMEDGTFYPLTVFKNKAKAHQIARKLQMALGKPLQEIAAPDHSFGTYKKKFLEQFDR